MKHFFPVLIGGTIAIAAIAAFFLIDLPLSSPLNEQSFSRFLPKFPHQKNEKIIYGFLPYWNLREVTLQPELTHLAYFSLTLAEDGTFVTEGSGGGTEPGYRTLQSDDFLALAEVLRNRGGHTDIVISQFSDETITAFLTSSAAHEQFLQSLDSVLLAYPFEGVNIDIEYAGAVTPELREQYVRFLSTVSEHLREKNEDITLSIDAYALAATKNMLWDLEKIAPLVDYVVVMAYDFHRSSSPTAGPAAPMFDKEAGWNESINTSLQAFVQKVPPEKLLLGIPFYGYEWQTTSSEPESFTFPRTGATASYKRVKELLTRREELGIEEHWEESALAPYLTYTLNDEHFMVYYENARSIAYKLEYVHQLNMAGIAIWSLGYDGSSRDLWESIRTQLN
jgi:spore germination protein YaaH